MKSTHLPHLTALFFASILASSLWAQHPARRCATVEYNKQKEQSNPALTEAREHFNQFIRQHSGEYSEASRTTITIPVVVHVIYNINIYRT